jgi:acyl carrier protein
MPITDRVASVFHKVFQFDSHRVSAATTPEDVPNWDSVGHMNLVTHLEEEFGRQFDVDDIMEMGSVGKIIEVLKAKGVED